MIPAIERHYRVITLVERLQQLEGELNVLAESAYGAEKYRIERAMWHAMKAADMLRVGPATERELTEVLQRSIALVREQKQQPPEGA